MVRVLFVTGFNRSGTTLVTTALTKAAGATTLTVGHLARHLPSVSRFLIGAKKQATVPDRGVDRLPVNESTPEEYGWLLNAATGEFAFSASATSTATLRALIDELAADSDTQVVVLKNPPDTGHEQLLLDHFPGSQVLLVRRELGAIEDSLGRAWSRMATSNRYMRALITDRRKAAETLGVILDEKARQDLVANTRRQTRRDAFRLARGVAKLPPDRIALLSYDELRANPRAATGWAAHLVDPDAFAEAIAVHAFPEYNRASRSTLTSRAIDAYWARAWRKARAQQVRAGIVKPTVRPAGSA